MIGYYRKRGEKWSFTVDVGKDPITRKRKQITKSGFKTKKEAQKACAEVVSEVENGLYIATSNQCLYAYIDEWLKLYCKQKLKETTYKSYKRAIDYRILPVLGEFEIGELKPTHGQAFVKHLVDEGLSERYIEYCFTVVKSALKQAVKWEILQKNPFQYVEVPRPRRKKEHATWSIEEINRFLHYAKFDNPIYYYIFMLALHTGMRRGELLGLKWSNVDLERGIISVSETLVYDGEGFRFSGVKTSSSRRTISIDIKDCDELRKYRKLQNEFKLAAFEYDDQDIVFCREDGRPIYPRTLAIIFDRVTKKAKVPKIRLHDLRHTHATVSLEIGIPPKVVQERLGHASIKVTMDTYAHVTPNMQMESAAAFSEAIRKQK